jgi:hypothetical protein
MLRWWSVAWVGGQSELSRSPSWSVIYPTAFRKPSNTFSLLLQHPFASTPIHSSSYSCLEFTWPKQLFFQRFIWQRNYGNYEHECWANVSELTPLRPSCSWDSELEKVLPHLSVHFLVVSFRLALPLSSHRSLAISVLSTNNVIWSDQWNNWWPRHLWVLGFDPLVGFLMSNFIDAIIALLIYDYFLTLGSEIERFWKGRFYRGLNWASFLFFANRYLTLLGYTPLALEISKQTDKGLPVRKSFEFNTHFRWLRLL